MVGNAYLGWLGLDEGFQEDHVIQSYSATNSIPIERIEDPTEEFFRKNYLEKGRPVVIVQKKSPPPQLKWDFDYLARVAGDSPVPVYDWGDKGPTVNDDFEITQMKLAEALVHAKKVHSPETQRYSVCQLSISRFLPSLSGEYKTPDFIANAESLDQLPEPFSETSRRALFVSFFRGIHWHNGREVVAQLAHGQKKFILYHPNDSRFLYPRKLQDSGMAWFDENEAVFCSEIPFENGLDKIDLKKFPLYEHASPYEVDLKAGESLFIPSHWWHFTVAHEPCIVIAHFWDSPLRRWGMPIGWRSLIMKPYRKYLYQHVLKAKKTFSKDSKIKADAV
jgi:hypothetical protein